MNWYCIHTKAQKELQVVGYLHERLNMETYFPQLKRRKTVRRMLRTVVSPLFPRYIFCRLDLTTQYRAVRYAPDVVDVIRFGSHPVVVGDVLVEELKGWAGDVLDLSIAGQNFRVGDRVEIAEGPMRGLSAVILHERSDDHRVAVLLSILECGAKLIVDRAQLKFPDQADTQFQPATCWQSTLAS